MMEFFKSLMGKMGVGIDRIPNPPNPRELRFPYHPWDDCLFAYMNGGCMANVAEYTSPMDVMGLSI